MKEKSMPSAGVLEQASKDVLRYHARRVHVRQTMSSGDKRLFYGSLALCGLAVIVATYYKALAGPAMFVGCIFPVVQIYFMFKSGIQGATNPTRKEAAEASLRYNKAIHVLTHCSDLEAVGPLLDVLWLPDMTGYVPLALRLLLPRLQPENSSLLTSRQRANLMRLLKEADPTAVELQKVTVRAVGRVGDRSALPVLEQIAAGKSIASTSTEVREEARRALYELQERIDPNYTGRNLLRASEAPATPTKELLRPAIGKGETPPDELLRALNGP